MTNDFREMLEGKHVILKYKKGGRIPDNYLYDSHEDTPQTALAFNTLLGLYAVNKETGRVELGTAIIGKGVTGLAPWEDHLEIIKRHMEAQKLGRGEDAEFKAERLKYSTPMRVADVFVSVDGTVTIEIESS